MKNKYLAIFIAPILLLFQSAFAQDLCKPVGWATQNGGVTGGGNASVTTVSTYADLKTAVNSSTAKVIYVQGVITIPTNGRITMQDQSGKTIIGLTGSKLVSTDLSASGSGIFYIKRCTNLIIRNMVFEGPGAYDADGNDNMTLDDCQNIWVDHCEFRDSMDGNLDIKNMSNYISITWTKFSYEKAPIPGGSGGSNDHRFSNLFGSSDGAIQDSAKLKITMQYCWWAQGCVERMPRVRFGQVHVANSLFNSSVSSTCIRAAYKADVLVENNAFIGVKNPIDLYSGYTAVTERNNLFTGTSGSKAGSGTAFTPPYTLTLANASTVEAVVKKCGGATLVNPSITACSACSGTVVSNNPPTISITSPANNATFTAPANITINAIATDTDGTISKVEFYNGNTFLGSATSSYIWANVVAGTYTIKVVATDNDGATSTASVNIIVGGATTSPATLTKHGSGSATQSINLGQPIVNFNYTWTNATNVTVSGMPQGVTSTIDIPNSIVSFTGTPTQVGTFSFTITTVGGNPNISKTGTITVANTVTNIENDFNSTSFTVSPNPFENFTTIQFEGQCTYQVFNSQGILVFDGMANSEIQLGTNFNKGLYLVYINREGETAKLKIVKE